MSDPAWLGHNEDNKVTVLYLGKYDTPAGQRRELARIIRTGRLVRAIKDADAAGKVWGSVISEAEMNRIAHPLSYDPELMNAKQIAEHLVAASQQEER